MPPSLDATGEPALKRSLGLFSVTVYGIGTIIGAGIFVLLGKLIGVAGAAAPLAFLLAAIIAGLTGLSYAQLATRLPYSAGEAVYVQEAFGRSWLTLAVGLMVALGGLLSSATIAHGFAGYLNVLWPAPGTLTAVLYLLVLGAVAISGIQETAWVVGFIAVTSTIGLIVLAVVIVVGDPDWRWPELNYSFSALPWVGLFLGAYLAFYACIGFEDLVNLAEEIKQPGRTLSIAIPVSLIFSSLVYIGLAIVALGAAPVHELKASGAPLAFLLNNAGLKGQLIVVVLSIVAITNGALAQLVMASRVLYGLGRQGLLPKAMADVNRHTRTPLLATGLVILAVVLAALSGDILSLARGTSGLVLIAFTLVNLSLLMLNWRAGKRLAVTNLLPLLAAGFCLLLVLGEAMRMAGLLEVAGD